MRGLMRMFARLVARLRPVSYEERYLARAADAHDLEARQRRLQQQQP